jgi:hypothetical protein
MKKKLFAVLMLFSIAGVANATLQTIGTATYDGTDYKLIYDVEDQLTWLDYSNSGAMYSQSLTWATGLNSAGVLTINLDEGYSASWDSTQWRLAGNVDGYFSASTRYIYSSEMEGLYYDELGNILNDPSLNFGDFENLLASYYHMSADAALTEQIGASWSPRFNFSNGVQEFGSSTVNGGIYGMAVIPGAVVPEPATLAILGLGVLALRRKK